MNTKAIGAAAEVIFRAMSKTGVVPATIAVALDANNLLAGPDAAADRAALRGEIDELRAQLEIAERRVDDLATTLAERDEQIAGLLADEVDLSDDQAGVPA